MKKLAILVTLALWTGAQGARPSCPAFADRNQYYFDSNNIAFTPDMLNILDKYGLTDTTTLNNFKRLASIFKAHRVTPVMLPLSPLGFTWAGHIDPAEAKGTPFEVLLDPNYLIQLEASNTTRLNIYRDSGFLIANYNQEALKSMKENPKVELYNRLDTHWVPAGSRLAAVAIQKSLQKSDSALLQEINQKQYSITFGTTDYYKFKGYPAVIRQKCPDTGWKAPSENITTVEITSLTPPDLLSDEVPPIILFGSSYSENFFGLPPYLQQMLGNDVTNAALTGGGIFGSLRNFYDTAKPEERWPKIIVWEFPDVGVFPDLEFRQLFPAMIDSTLVESHKVKSDRNLIVTSFKTPGLSGQKYFVELQFEQPPARELQVTLAYAGSKETLVLSKTTGDAPKRFAVELRGTEALKSISFEPPMDYQGSIVLNVRKYKALPVTKP